MGAVGVLRHVVFPALRLLVWAVIAVALCVLAFGRGTGPAGVEAGGPLEPVADLAERTVPVTVGRIESTVTVSGTVAADPPATVRSTANGAVRRLRVKVGDRVEASTALLDVAVPQAAPATLTPDGLPAATPPPRIVTVRAGTAGTVATLPVLVDQEVAVGTDLATVSPGGLTVTAPLTQAQQFRLLTPPAAASAQAPGGPAPFDCVDLTTEAAAGATDPPAVPDPYTGGMPQATTAQLRCRVPAGTTVFAGMSVNVTVETGAADGALLVPVTAVLGTVDRGTVWVPTPDGAPQERPVRLGITDGAQVQVVEGLAEGDEVLEFTPVPADDVPAEGGPEFGGPGVVMS